MSELWNPEVEERIRAEAKSLDEQTGPKEIKFCKKCVISNQRPRITFDKDGVCSACNYAERKNFVIDWDSRAEGLASLLSRHRGRGHYDVVVPCSGGKDSAFVAHTLKHEHGMNPLCVKWAPFIYTDIGFKNFHNFIQSGYDCLTAFPNGLIHRKLARLSFEYYGDHFIPFIFGQLCYPMRMAQIHDIPLVMFGENGEAEYGGDTGANDKPSWDTDDWDRIYQKGSSVNRLIEIGLELGALSEQEVKEITPFYSLPPMEFDRIPEFNWLGYYLKWHPQSNYYLATQRFGFEANPDGRSEGTHSKYASLDDKTDGLHYFMGYIKFGIGRCTSDAAHEVRDGDITRDEAVALVKRYDGEVPLKSLTVTQEYLGMENNHFWQAVNRFRNERIWKRDNALYETRKNVYDVEDTADSPA